jgi:hypothetical protein
MQRVLNDYCPTGRSRLYYTGVYTGEKYNISSSSSAVFDRLNEKNKSMAENFWLTSSFTLFLLAPGHGEKVLDQTPQTECLSKLDPD